MRFKRKNTELFDTLVELTKHIEECQNRLKDLREQVMNELLKRKSSDVLVIGDGEFSIRETPVYRYSRGVDELEDKVEKLSIILKVKREREVQDGIAKKIDSKKVLVVKVAK